MGDVFTIRQFFIRLILWDDVEALLELPQPAAPSSILQAYPSCARIPLEEPVMRISPLFIVPLSLVVVLCRSAAPVFAHEEDAAAPAPGEKLGTVHFSTSCHASVAERFDRGMAMFHSFWFDPAAQVFADVAQADPKCAMAHWGVAMTRLGNPFAWPPAEKQFAAGQAALAKAREIGARTVREVAYIEALGRFYEDPQKADLRTRAVAFQQAMGELVQRYPDDTEAQILYALLLDATICPRTSSRVWAIGTTRSKPTACRPRRPKQSCRKPR
jgi:hypothetical protein